MEKESKISGFKESVILALILLAGMGLFFWKAGFFEPEGKPSCGVANLELCDTKEICEKNDFYWWNETCHMTTKPSCGISNLGLCNTKDLCESNDLYWWDNACHIVEKPSPIFSEYPDYDNLKDLNSLALLEDKVSWSPEGKIEKIISYSKKLKSTGEFSRIYLYGEASVNNKPLTQYESLYVKFNYTGGHLFRPQSLKIPPDTITRLLYAVNNVPYLATIPYSENRTPLTTDWFKFFKDDSLITFDVFISSLKPAMINKIALYYDCAEGSDCNIEILK